MKHLALAFCAALIFGCASSQNRPPEITSAGGVVYPEQARTQKLEGYVRVAYDVTADGSVANVHVIEAKPPGVFDEAALKAVRSWKFHPAVHNGKVVDATNVVSRINFKLGESPDYAR